jgi:hypothetical protein
MYMHACMHALNGKKKKQRNKEKKLTIGSCSGG